MRVIVTVVFNRANYLRQCRPGSLPLCVHGKVSVTAMMM